MPARAYCFHLFPRSSTPQNGIETLYLFFPTFSFFLYFVGLLVFVRYFLSHCTCDVMYLFFVLSLSSRPCTMRMIRASSQGGKTRRLFILLFRVHISEWSSRKDSVLLCLNDESVIRTNHSHHRSSSSSSASCKADAKFHVCRAPGAEWLYMCLRSTWNIWYVL